MNVFAPIMPFSIFMLTSFNIFMIAEKMFMFENILMLL